MRISDAYKKAIEDEKADSIKICTDFLLEGGNPKDIVSDDNTNLEIEKKAMDVSPKPSIVNKDIKEVEKPKVAEEKTPVDKEEKPVRNRKSNTGLKRLFFLLGILLVLIAIMLIIIRNRHISVDAFSSHIDRMYETSSKEQLKGYVTEDTINKCITKAEDLQPVTEKDYAKVTEINDELTTMLQYYKDDKVLSEIEDTDYDMSVSDMHERLNEVYNHMQGYTVNGLSDNIKSRINDVEDDYDKYENLKAELSLIMDYINFDYKGYMIRVNEIKHTPNREELSSMVTNLNFEKLKAQGVKNAKDKAKEEVSKLLGSIEDKNDTSDIVNNIKGFFEGLWQKLSNWN